MEPTLTAVSPDAALSAQALWIERTQKALELLRVDSTIIELRQSPWPNERLIAWYEGRREVLARELGIQGSGVS